MCPLSDYTEQLLNENIYLKKEIAYERRQSEEHKQANAEQTNLVQHLRNLVVTMSKDLDKQRGKDNKQNFFFKLL